MTTRIAPGVGANLLGQHSAERNQDATAYVGNLDPQATEDFLWELFVQAVNVYVPKDRVTNLHQGYGFVEFRSEKDAIRSNSETDFLMEEATYRWGEQREVMIMLTSEFQWAVKWESI
ncbi:eukaryotic translation initiation factor 3 subunit G-like isoform X2 [Manihot esculenta]|uniref:eukaryotic translation initiation factor 3 subunit G-like isoform X2 n=2 Tax=Manihot esculenta TaxID=3983 RepID=UPI000B5D9158|nr:eukaryotic translation initiation factor 3 subunit G-like isoform X2 [Manihot esculenta]